MTIRSQILLVLLGCFLCAHVQAQQTQDIRIEMKGAAMVSGGVILLGDIADVSAADAGLAATISAVSLGVSPLPGNARVIKREHAAMYLARGGADIARMRWQGSDACTVSVYSTRVTGSKIADAARKYLAAHPLLQGEDTQIQLLQTPRDQVVAGEAVPELTATAAGLERPYGHVRINVSVMAGGNVVATVPVAFQITSRQQVLFASRPIARGDMVVASDLESKEILIGGAGDTNAYYSDLTDLVGKAAVRAIPAGVPVGDSMVVEPLAIKRGQSVSVLLRSPVMEITTKGIAQRDARLGDSIGVKISATGKEIICNVVAMGSVEIPL